MSISYNSICDIINTNFTFSIPGSFLSNLEEATRRVDSNFTTPVSWIESLDTGIDFCSSTVPTRSLSLTSTTPFRCNSSSSSSNRENGFEVVHRRKKSSRNSNTNSHNHGGNGNNKRMNSSSYIKYSHEQSTFTATKFKPKTGTEVNIDAVRVLLNKLTNKNYGTMIDLITVEIDNIAQSDSDADGECNIGITSKQKIGEIIFEIASSNRFYSETYAELFCELIKRYPTYNDILQTNIDIFIEMFSTIKFVDPNEDYDLFCQNNKLNEKRKALAAFFVNLMNNGLVHIDVIAGILNTLLSQVFSGMMDADKKSENDEIFETVGILFKSVVEHQSSPTLSVGEFDTAVDFIKHVSTVKTKTTPGISNKSIFKCMDMLGI
jgi:hypothetical protein